MSAEQPPVVDLPTSGDITARIAAFLLDSVVPALEEPATKHRTRVAAHLLELLAREARAGDRPAVTVDADGRLTTEELVQHYGSVARLTEELDARRLDVLDPQVLQVLRDHTALKVGIAEIRRADAPHDSKEPSA